MSSKEHEHTEDSGRSREAGDGAERTRPDAAADGVPGGARTSGRSRAGRSVPAGRGAASGENAGAAEGRPRRARLRLPFDNRREDAGGVGVRPPYRVVHHADRLSGADDRLRLVEDRGGAPAPPAGHVHRLAVARRTGAGARPPRGGGAPPAAGGRGDRLAEYPQRGVERECAERETPGRPRHERRGAERCRRRGRGAHARQPRSLRTGPGRGAGDP